MPFGTKKVKIDERYVSRGYSGKKLFGLDG